MPSCPHHVRFRHQSLMKRLASLARGPKLGGRWLLAAAQKYSVIVPVP
ncbi:MAG: hypothetical protein WA209_05900 [Candidatus Acidiferrales bacterium]